MATAVNMSKLIGLVKKGKTLPEAAGELGHPVSVVGPHYYKAEVEANPKLKFKGTGTAIKRARDKDGLRWERIAARTNMSVAAVKSAYEEAGGDLSDSWTGRGRKPGSNGTSTKKAGRGSAASKPAARKATPPARGGGRRAAGGKTQKARTRAQRAAKSGNPS